MFFRLFCLGVREHSFSVYVRFYKKEISNPMLSIVTAMAIVYSSMFKKRLLAYFPIIRLEEVRLICKKTVIGNCMLSMAWEMRSPLKGSDIKNIINKEIPNDSIIPI